MSAGAPMIKPVLIGTVATTRGDAGVTARPGTGVVSVGISLLSASLTAAQAVELAQLLVQGARVALGEGSAS